MKITTQYVTSKERLEALIEHNKRTIKKNPKERKSDKQQLKH